VAPTSMYIQLVTNSVVYGVELLELFREGYVADAWFQSEDNLVGLEYSNEDGLWYLDNRVVVPAGATREKVLEEAHAVALQPTFWETQSFASD
jgi:hypothetical protein